jgi:aspartate/methionine/tyrosine aminotransferase
MKIVSDRIAAVQAPIIPVVAALIRSNPGTISLGQGVVNYGPPAEAYEAIRHFQDEKNINKYQAVHGMPALIQAIEQKLARENNLHINPNSRVVVTAGGNMAFLNAVLAIADPGDEIILPTPYYFNQEMAIVMTNCKAVLVPCDSSYQLDLEAIERAITSKTRAIVTISPNNPSGAVYSAASLRAVNMFCRKRGIYHISDEAYEYFVYDGAQHFSPGSIPGSEPYTISLYSLSKAYGLASWRIGYMVIPEGLFEAICKIQDTNVICPAAISQIAATAAIQRGVDYCKPHIGALADIRTAVFDALRTLEPRCEIPNVHGALYCFIKVDTPLSSMELTEKLIREYKVAVIPGSAFGVENRCTLRISYGALDKESVVEGVGRLVKGLKAILNT